MKTMSYDQFERKLANLSNKWARHPVNTPKRRRVLRRQLRLYAVWFRDVQGDESTARVYERTARKF